MESFSSACDIPEALTFDVSVLNAAVNFGCDVLVFFDWTLKRRQLQMLFVLLLLLFLFMRQFLLLFVLLGYAKLTDALIYPRGRSQAGYAFL